MLGPLHCHRLVFYICFLKDHFMLITFDRKGYANNSSSSHSIIFSPSISKSHSDDYNANSFQWDNFTITSREGKEAYLLTQWLMSVYERHSENPSKKIRTLFDELKNNPKTNEIFLHIEDYYYTVESEDDDKKDRKWYSSDISVDHQSVITWPKNLITNEYDIDFFLEFCKEILEKEYVILGGNDNSDDHPLKPEEDVNDDYDFDKKKDVLKRNFIDFYNSLIESGELFSIKDKKTNEWIISSNSMGWLTKFIFDSDLTEMGINLNNPTTFFSDENINEDIKKSGFPYLIDMKISSYCSFGCAYCYTSSTVKGEHADADFIIKELLPVLKTSGVMEVVLGGGEPTLHPRFLDILKALHEMKFKIGFTTKNFNLHKHPDIEEILNNTHSIAFSINELSDVEEIQELLLDISIVRERTTRQNPTMYAQLILGLKEWKETFEIVQALTQKKENFKNFYNITFLGLKRFGFGTEYVNKIENDKWIFDIKKLAKDFYFNVGIDSVLASKYKDILVNHHHISYNRLTGAEGKQTCYIDAVDKKISASSFTKNVKDFDNVTVDNFLNLYSTF